MHRDNGESIQEMAWAKKHLAKAVFAEIVPEQPLWCGNRKPPTGEKDPTAAKK